MKNILSSSIFAMALLATSATHASSVIGYVCNVTYLPDANVHGDYGSVAVNVNTAANCLGNSTNNLIVNSEGSVVPSDYHYSEAGLLKMFDSLHRAQVKGQRLSIQYDVALLQFVTFLGN